MGITKPLLIFKFQCEANAQPVRATTKQMIYDPFSSIGGMTRKHFRLLADALQHNAPTFASSDAEVALFTQIVSDIATACRHANPRFDRGRFEAASGLVKPQCRKVNARQEIICAL